jgi:hypothetical protein
VVDCPRCGTPTSNRCLNCQKCGYSLESYGAFKPELAAGSKILCTTCRYDRDDSCTFPDRPQATRCTLYRSLDEPAPVAYRPRFNIRNYIWVLVLGGLLLVSVGLTLR